MEISLKPKHPNRSHDKHWAWRGKDVGYVALHQYVYSRYGKATKCEECGLNKVPDGKKRWFNWANMTGLHLRNRSNWKMLCIPCHRKYDKWNSKVTDKYISAKPWLSRARNKLGHFI